VYQERFGTFRGERKQAAARIAGRGFACTRIRTRSDNSCCTPIAPIQALRLHANTLGVDLDPVVRAPRRQNEVSA
jgi:hypothetical protein